MNWATILTQDELDLMWEDMAVNWPSHAAARREWWESRTLPELYGRLAGAWNANEMESYAIARSYIAARMEAENVA